MENLNPEVLLECKIALSHLLSRRSLPSNPNAPSASESIPPSSCYKRWKVSDRVFDGTYNSSGCSTPCTPATLTDPRRILHLKNESLASSFRKNSSEFLSFMDNSDLTSYSPPLSHKNSLIDTFEDSSGRYEHDFVQLGVLGAGEFGTVFKCLNKIDGFYYAVKQLKITARHLRNEALQEAFILASSSMVDDNCYVIRYYSVWAEHSHFYICMELCESSLKRFIEKKEASEDLLRKIMRDVLKGLKKIHANNIVHMDIKPENILYSKYGRFKLADLGLARVTTNLVSEIPEGDCRYLAAEVLEDIEENHIPDLTKADIFSLGATMLEIMRGQSLPKNGEEWHDIRNGRIEIPKGYSFRLRKTVEMMLERDPSQRPSAAWLLDEVFMSESKKEAAKWKNYASWLEKKSQEHTETPVKKRKLSF
jgi:hypothetical protein